MAKNKTTETESSVADFINKVGNGTKRADSFAIVNLMESLTKLKAKMWGPAIVGFGSYHYKYASGHEGDAPLIGFSPRANDVALYIGLNNEQREELLPQFGKHKAGKGCIWIKKLSDINLDVLEKMIVVSMEYQRSKILTNQM